MWDSVYQEDMMRKQSKPKESQINQALAEAIKEVGVSEHRAIDIWYKYNTEYKNTHSIASSSNVEIEKVNKITEIFAEFSKVGKGVKGGLCNRGQCQTPKDVVFFNKGTSKYYCCGCSIRINEACRPHELEQLFGEGTKYLCLTDDGLDPYAWERKQVEDAMGGE